MTSAVCLVKIRVKGCRKTLVRAKTRGLNKLPRAKRLFKLVDNRGERYRMNKAAIFSFRFVAVNLSAALSRAAVLLGAKVSLALPAGDGLFDGEFTFKQ